MYQPLSQFTVYVMACFIVVIIVVAIGRPDMIIVFFSRSILWHWGNRL